jgi:hypothetical protein
VSESNRSTIAEWGIEDAWIVRPLVIEWFKAGARRIIDVSDRLYGAVFEPLRDPGYFLRGMFDAEAGTITWPNGADFAPEFLLYGPADGARSE